MDETLNKTEDKNEEEILQKNEEVQEELVDEAAAEYDTDSQQDSEDEESVGNIKISIDVVSTIAGIAASELDGVAYMHGSFAGGIVEKLGAKKSPSKGVKVEMTEDSVVVDLYIVVDYGVRIPELAWEIQENVKNNIETMTGLEVEKVNIHIEGVSFEKEKAEALNAANTETENLLAEGENE